MSTKVSLGIIPSSETACVGEGVDVAVVLRVDGDAVNAAQGTLRYDPSALRVESVNTGGSVFRFWAVRPTVDASRGTVTFAGGLPTPGYVGSDGLLMTLKVIPQTGGTATELVWDGAGSVLLNDGKGTPADTVFAGASLTVPEESELICAVPRQTPTPTADSVSPEPFDVVIARSADAFNGQYFASFYAYDAGSGIARYEVRENGDVWYQAWSPYILKTQKGTLLLEVKAVDASGNQRIASTSAALGEAGSPAFGPWWFWLVAAIAVALGVWRLMAKRRQERRTLSELAKERGGDIPHVTYDQSRPMP